MTRRPLAALGLLALLGTAACAGSASATVTPTDAPTAAPSAAAEAPCAPTTEAGTVAVAMQDFAFSPASVSAKVGDVIAFTNAGAMPHSAALDEGDCSTAVLSTGASEGLTFSAAGTYAYHCTVHAAMTGTIEVGD